MKEKLLKKVSFVETVKAVVEVVERLRNDYESQKEYYEKNILDESREDFWKTSDREYADEFARKVDAIDEIYSALLKMI